ncbi:HD domain-containing phosphohydrolase [Natronincola ferrireducens]|uniref:Stage 0 sporulation protein A homolog n=1 Tax=Natronincola ferrireducens TaxID=393762 RepID=A0A1G9EJ67_9FIRM|nr:HD domain-containing phosphohydrolase [Natronincola ferrireducens]SDK76200.1 PAS domain S-box-containing protein/diguanylate cyclase (GGDEF) domain-containing protein [Natronincola ferrireducens]
MEKIRILVVEDCKITSKTIQKSLLSLGYKVVEIVTSGEAAVNACFLHKPDLILMDIEIEGNMNGIEAADKIRLSFDIPIIYLTALSDEDTLTRAKATGGFAYLIKPFRKRDLYANIEMITYAHKMKRKAKENEVKYRNIFNNMFEGFAYYKVVLDENNIPVDYIFLEVNDAFEKLLEVEREKIIGKSIREVFESNENNGFIDEMGILQEAIGKEKNLHIHEHYFKKVQKWISITISIPQKGYLSILLTNITERKTSEEKLKYLTFYDKLTGLYNRAYFEEELKRYDTKRQLPLSVIVGDINGLKLANDVFGHKEGDKLLINVAQKLKKSCRSEDLVARWGGDEFVILLPKADEEAVKDICARIREACRLEDDCLIPTSIALGFVTKSDEEDILGLLVEAENKMYKNKLLESKKAHENIINSLKLNLTIKTHETIEHMNNIKEKLLLMADYLKLSIKVKNELMLLAEFHDIGKISTPKKILNKPTTLTKEEWDIIKQHPVTGYRIASSSTNLIPIAEAILFHHEWWDGTGYPLGVKQKDIPITARLLAIADAYDVMTRGRLYKNPLSSCEALREIKNCANKQFDPEFVEIFIKIMDVNTVI